MSCDPRCHLSFQPGPQLPLQDSLVAEVGRVQLDGEELLEAPGWPSGFNMLRLGFMMIYGKYIVIDIYGYNFPIYWD